MMNFMQSYVSFFNEHWILLAILWVLLVILARTKMEMHWLDIIIPGVCFLLWFVFWLII